MKTIFQKNLQLKAPGGNIYEWKSAETKLQVPIKGLYAIKIEASAKSAKQNKSTDDDDLKMALDAIIAYFKISDKPFSAQFIRHSIEDNPSPLIFHSNDAIVKKIKKDPSYNKIVEKLREKIDNGILEGEIWPKDFKHDEIMKGQINFDSPDLATALHGIKKIDYKAEPKENNKFKVEFMLFDIYDFQKEDVPPLLSGFRQALKQKIINEFDMGEDLEIIHNFETEIHITQILYDN